MSLMRVSAVDALARWSEFDAVIDARSPNEYAEDHLPDALNWPVLNDDERRIVGTEYKQASAFDARKRGAAMVARNIARHIETQVMVQARGWRPLVYCWRGGQRSGALAMVLEQIGFHVQVLEGGYREFRRAVLAELEVLPATLSLRVICGRTGSAKSRLLGALRERGEQVLDLEALACHRGSVLGLLPGQPQPSQKAFETAVWQALRGFDAAREVFVEGESRTIGRLRVPERLLERMRASTCVQLQMATPARVAFLLDDYSHFVVDRDTFCNRLDALRELRGAATVERWQAEARAGRLAGVVEQLLELHYDPAYQASMQRNFKHFASAAQVGMENADAATLQRVAAGLSAPSPSPSPSL